MPKISCSKRNKNIKSFFVKEFTKDVKFVIIIIIIIIIIITRVINIAFFWFDSVKNFDIVIDFVWHKIMGCRSSVEDRNRALTNDVGEKCRLTCTYSLSKRRPCYVASVL